MIKNETFSLTYTSKVPFPLAIADFPYFPLHSLTFPDQCEKETFPPAFPGRQEMLITAMTNFVEKDFKMKTF